MELHPFVAALIGGMLIGLAAAIVLLGFGRVAGISGIFAGLLRFDELNWRWPFVMGLPLGALAVSRWVAPVAVEITSSTPILIGAGLLVGFGTRVGNGCTSGHGVCGISRGSRRSIVATMVFMGTAMLTVLVVRHVL